jgi:hypothetical protein
MFLFDLLDEARLSDKDTRVLNDSVISELSFLA